MNGSPSDESTWTLARRETATAANAFLEQGVAVVAEGSFNLPSTTRPSLSIFERAPAFRA
jgi:hypothetical protein